MPQILKEDVKDRIERSALNIILEKGLHNTDMRSIAKMAGITPGNLYRYFKNKDQLIISITQPIIDSLSQILERETDGEINLSNKIVKIEKAPAGVSAPEYMYSLVYTRIINVITKIAIMGKKHPKRMEILLRDNAVSQGLINWVIQLITNTFGACVVPSVATQYQIETMIVIFTRAFCEGVLQLLKVSLITDIENFEKLLERYVTAQLCGIKQLLETELENKTILPNPEVFSNENI